jgi:hypothetical protein
VRLEANLAGQALIVVEVESGPADVRVGIVEGPGAGVDDVIPYPVKGGVGELAAYRDWSS